MVTVASLIESGAINHAQLHANEGKKSMLMKDNRRNPMVLEKMK